MKPVAPSPQLKLCLFQHGIAVKIRHNCHPGCNVPVVFNAEAVTLPKSASKQLDAMLSEAGDTPAPCPAAAAASAPTIHESRVLMPMQWGLVPGFEPSAKKPDFWRAFNARSESIATKPMFRRLVDQRRCVVLLDGFYEWTVDARKEKQPYYVHALRASTTPAPAAASAAASTKDDGDAGILPPPLMVAGLFDMWRQRRPATEQEQAAGGEAASGWVEHDVWTCTLLTRAASPALEWLHDRMPVILQSDAAVSAWLSDSPLAEVLQEGSPVTAVMSMDATFAVAWRPVSKQCERNAAPMVAHLARCHSAISTA